MTAEPRTRVIVAGAGLSGLACAFDLARKGAQVAVLEKSARAGGVVDSVERGGFLFETGPNTVQASSAAFRRLCDDLGIAERLIVAAPASKERYLLLDGALRPLPASPVSFLRSGLLSLRARLRVGTEILRRWRAPAPGVEEPDLESFLNERLGAEATRLVFGSFVRGVYAAELRELGAKSAFPRLWRACEEHGGLVRGLLATLRRSAPDLPGPTAPSTALLSFPRGLRELVDALAGALGERLQAGSAIARIERRSGGFAVRTSDGRMLEADRVVLAVQAPEAARLLEPCAGASVPVEHLRGVRHAALTLVHLGLRRSEIPGLPAGFGFLVPPQASGSETAGEKEAPGVLGTIFASNLFPGRAPEDCAAVSIFYRSSTTDGLDEEGIAALAAGDLARALRQARPPRVLVADIRRWTDVIPRYAPGHAGRMAELARALDEALPGLHLAGSYVAGVSVEQVINRGRATADEIMG